MTPPDVLYCIEHDVRELDIACAVRAIARARYGVDVRLHFLANELDAAVQQGQPKLVVVPSCTSRAFAHQEIFQRLSGAAILNAACEQLFSPGNRHYRLPRDQFARRHVLHVAAGEFFQNWLLESGVEASHILLTGSPTFQLYLPPYSRYYESNRAETASSYGLDASLPWILMPENFGAAFFKPSHVRKRIRGGYHRRQLAEYVDYSTRSFREIAKWCSAAAATGAVEVIVRPRPAMSRDVFARAFVDASGEHQSEHLHFIKEGSVREWIFASQITMSSYSTTLLEAAVAGRPAYLLSPFPVPESASSSWHDYAPRIQSRAELLEVVRQAETVNCPSQLREWAQANLLGHGDAIENMARIIGDICRGQLAAPRPYRRPALAAAVGQAYEGLKLAERAVRRRLRPSNTANFVYEGSRVDQQGIDQRTDHWTKLLCEAGLLRAA